jgi:hypothetical protein
VDTRDQPLDILSEIRSTTPTRRKKRLEKLAAPMLVEVAGVMLAEWEREVDRLRVELEKRDFHICRLEDFLGKGPGSD